MMRNDFCIFILSYKRADNMKTINTLMKCNYSGKYYIVVGNDDPTVDDYVKNFGEDKIIIFDKEKYRDLNDTCDNFNRMNIVLYARNFCFDIAKKLGYKYFLQLDDDYTNFRYRFEKDGQFKTCYVREFNEVVDIMIDFLDTTKSHSVAFGQSGDYIGGKDSSLAKAKIKRKAMNSFFCTTERPFKFVGTINEDVNTYCMLGSQGSLFMTITDVSLDQVTTQAAKGGLTEAYLDSGTYVKSFYSVITNPSCVKVYGMDTIDSRIHHRVEWNNAVPKIISDKYKKI